MDRAYLRMRHIQSKGGARQAKEDDLTLNRNKDDEAKKIVNPVYVQSVKTYKQISQNFNSLHAQ